MSEWVWNDTLQLGIWSNTLHCESFPSSSLTIRKNCPIVALQNEANNGPKRWFLRSIHSCLPCSHIINIDLSAIWTKNMIKSEDFWRSSRLLWNFYLAMCLVTVHYTFPTVILAKFWTMKNFKKLQKKTWSKTSKLSFSVLFSGRHLTITFTLSSLFLSSTIASKTSTSENSLFFAILSENFPELNSSIRRKGKKGKNQWPSGALMKYSWRVTKKGVQ